MPEFIPYTFGLFHLTLLKCPQTRNLYLDQYLFIALKSEYVSERGFSDQYLIILEVRMT